MVMLLVIYALEFLNRRGPGRAGPFRGVLVVLVLLLIASAVLRWRAQITVDGDGVQARTQPFRRSRSLSWAEVNHFELRGYWRGLGARTVERRLPVTAASSKASLGLAHVLTDDDIAVIGVTSAPHRAAVDTLDLLDDVVIYDQLGALATGKCAVLVDVVGDPLVRASISSCLGAALVETVLVGQTDWQRPADGILGHDGDTAFFAPTAIGYLVSRWGPAAFAQRLDEALTSFVSRSHGWLSPDHRDGRAAVVGAFDDVAAGRPDPHRFIVVRPHHC